MKTQSLLHLDQLPEVRQSPVRTEPEPTSRTNPRPSPSAARVEPPSGRMDPTKSPSAPPPDWSGGKAAAGPAPPPPYEDVPQMGYAQPGAGYPVQGYGPAPQYGGYGQQLYPGQPYPGQPYPGQPYPGQPVAVGIQPTVYVAQGPLENPVQDYLCYSIFTMLCCSCCLPLGIAALIYSITAREANHVGDRMAAERSSRTARTLNHVALGIGIGVMVLSIVYVLVLVLIH